MTNDTVTFKPGDTVTVDRHGGVAWYIQGHAVEYEYDNQYEDVEPLEIEMPDRFVCVMVGDDREHEFDVDDLTHLDEDGYCPGCGQTGCGHYR